MAGIAVMLRIVSGVAMAVCSLTSPGCCFYGCPRRLGGCHFLMSMGSSFCPSATVTVRVVVNWEQNTLGTRL